MNENKNVVSMRRIKGLGETDLAIGANIRRLRRQSDLTLKSLAHALGISSQQLQKYEVGTSRVSGGMLVQLAKALNVNLMSLFPSEPSDSQQMINAASTREDLIKGLAAAIRDLDANKLQALLALAKTLAK